MKEIARRILDAAYESIRPQDRIAEIALLSGVKNLLKTLERYEENRKWYSRALSFEVELFKRYLRRGMRHLDVGSGYGRFLGVFREIGLEYVLVEPDPVMRAILEARGEAPVDAVASNLPFEDGEFESLSITWVLHDIPEEERIPSLEECFRVLRRGGIFISFEPASDIHDPSYISEFVEDRGRILERHLRDWGSGRKSQYLVGEKT